VMDVSQPGSVVVMVDVCSRIQRMMTWS